MSRIIKGKAEADKTYRDLDNYEFHEKRTQ